MLKFPFTGCLRVSSCRHSDRENIHNQLQGRIKTRIDSDIPINVSFICFKRTELCHAIATLLTPYVSAFY